MNRRLHLALVQNRYRQDVHSNQQRNFNAIRQAAREGASLVVLPELHNHLYFPQQEDPLHFDMAEPLDGPTNTAYSQIARECRCVVVSSVFEKRAPGLYHNTAVVWNEDGSRAGYYRKMHIPDDPGYYEKYYFTPGDQGFVPIDTSVGRLGILICWDQWFPEAARLMALAGAQLLIYPTAIGWEPPDPKEIKQQQLQAWQIIQRSHAIANAVPVVSVNRCGREGPPGHTGIDFWGRSFAAASSGEIVASAGGEEEIVHAWLDLQETENQRRTWPFLRDRLIDAYAGLQQRYLDPV